MQIHGVRIYPKSVQVIEGSGAPILLHGRVNTDVSDMFYIFAPTAPLWKDHLFVNDFALTIGEDPLPGLHRQYGSSLINADVKTQLLMLRGDDFLDWAADQYTVEGAFLPILREPLPSNRLKELYWQRRSRLQSDTWPPQMRAALHMWDDIYWQFFSTERSDIELLVQTHADDPRLALYYVDFDREFPDPSNQRLQPVTGTTPSLS
jgi:hypothetical protein